MKALKRFLGIVWLAFAAFSGYFCIFTFGLPKLATGKQDDLVFGIIILAILTPLIVAGLATFGYFSVKGEYDDV
ncbi:hypothetical protein SAMN05421780_10499 [Flexibacter flexilis DSM 6793]|uniref:Uncharacterized protein n=1 Tax=Flexibacter flexilis DSM 6793 TaxID=927664 RepID=A0A1I1I330_9BACT|nr:hypothetical protein [Flexibacter flexilis]SFC27620.1 hypothetical protein SAMN05421780_10499 [Flexibacter flexilis DSM 6793]